MKFVVTGKGGAGKTTVAAVMARLAARSGAAVVAVDADPSPNLGIALGLGVPETARLDAIANSVLRQRAAHSHAEGEDHGASLPAAERAEALLTEMGVTAPDGVRLVQTGRIERPADGCLCCGSHGTTRRLFADLDGGQRAVIADLEAGLSDLVWAHPRPGDAVVIVTEPYRKSLEVARRAVQVSRDLGVDRIVIVANRSEGETDVSDVAQVLAGAELFEVPDDPAVAEATRRGRSPLDTAPDCAAVRAIETLARRLLG